jgi:hypothetical protein
MKAIVALALMLPALCFADFDKAVVRFYFGPDSPVMGQPSEAVVVKRDLPKLMSFFPGLKERKKGSKPAGWIAATEIRFLGKNAAPLVVRVNVYETIWTWGNGNGDFRPSDDLKAYLAELQRKAKPVKKRG